MAPAALFPPRRSGLLFVRGMSVAGATIPPPTSLGGLMRRTAAVVFVAVLALAGCSSGGEPKQETVTVTATPPPATPSLSQAETMRLCSVAVAEAAPGWEDWNFDLGGWQDDPRTPAVCLPLADEEFPPRGNRAFQQALIDGLEMADDPRAGR